MMNQVVIKVIGNYSYQTTRCLGQGVYGKVYQGTQKQTKQKVAIKKIDLATFTNDKYLENAIFSQIYLLKRFNHINIVKFKDVLSSKNSLYIITEFCKNGDLKEVLKKRKFKQEQAFDVLKQILNGFNELVRERIIHRDLKPANILISDGVYKIGDFGFAKYVDNFGSQMLKSCVGSPIYMAPQILQRTPYTTKCDVWSIGVIFYQMTHNSPPWKAKDENQLLRGVKNISISQILRKSNLTSKGADFLKRTLAYSEEQRIGWAQLFENYGSKGEKHSQSTQRHKNSTKQKHRVISANSSSNLSTGIYTTGSINNKIVPLTPINTSSNSIGQQNHSTSPQRKKNMLLQAQTQQQQGLSKRSESFDQKKSNQLDNIYRWRQFLLFYHFYCVEFYANFYQFCTVFPNKQELYSKMLLSLSLLVKNRSTFCLSMIAIHSRTLKSAQQLYKNMKSEHESYEILFNDIVILNEKLSLYKTLKAQITNLIGHGEVINQQRMQKIELYILEIVIQNMLGVGNWIKIKQRQRSQSGSRIGGLTKDTSIGVLLLQNIVQIGYLCGNRVRLGKTVEQIVLDWNNEMGNGSSINGQNGVNLAKTEQLKNRKLGQEYKQWGQNLIRDTYAFSIIQKYEKTLIFKESSHTNKF